MGLTTAVIFPSRFEADGLLSKLVHRRRLDAPLPMWQGELEARIVRVAVIGIGKSAALRGSRQFLQVDSALHPPVERCLLAGFAGGLIADLPRLSVCHSEDGGLHTAEDLVATAEQKYQLHLDTGARLVDMEYAYLAPLFAEHGLPFSWLRVISDADTDTLPAAALARSVDPHSGKPTPFRLCAHLLRHPFDFPPFIEFICRLPEVRDVLTKALLEALQSDHAASGQQQTH